MTTDTERPVMTGGDTPMDYRSMPTDELIHRIAFCGNRAALREFHEKRRLFRIKDGPPLLLVEFVQMVLKEERRIRFFGLPTSALDRAYDLTIDKFSILPDCDATGCSPEPRDQVHHLKRSGMNCRYQFRAIAKAIRLWHRTRPDADPLTTEAATAQIIQRRVACHCWWSCLEAQRGHRWGWSRFHWQPPDGSVTVWMPRWMSGRQRRAWLEAHVAPPGSTDNGDKQRIQAIIDGHFGTPEPVPLNEYSHTASQNSETQPVIDRLIEYETAEHGLAEFVAREKAMRLDEQRGAICRLGRKRLIALIHRVFDELVTGRLEDHAIAAEFGLSPATFSRFAGSRWKPGDGRRIPDLWRNTAQVVSCLPVFRSSAKAAGLWHRVESVAHGNVSRGPINA